MGKYAEIGEASREEFVIGSDAAISVLRGIDPEFKFVQGDEYTISQRGQDTVIEVLNHNGVIKNIIKADKMEKSAPKGPDFNKVREQYQQSVCKAKKANNFANVFNTALLILVVLLLIFIYLKGGLLFGH